METVIGRHEELALLEGLAERSASGAAALVLEGEVGIGKTTLWRAGVVAAEQRSLQVLATRPAEAERNLAHAGLGDLFEGALDELLPSLPAPRRSALEVALLLADPEGRPPDARAIGVAVLAGLRILAEAKPVLIAVDDVQWLDASSAASLEFALRRLTDYPTLLLLTRRSGEAGPAPESALPPEVVTRRKIGPLTLGAIHQLLLGQLGRAFPRPTLLRIHETSDGNPFLALELARALARTDAPLTAGEPFPVPETLEALVHDRLEALPEDARSVLVAATVLADPTVEQLASGWPNAADSLETARREEVITIERGRVRFTHPLLASVLLEQAPPDQRRRLHARLAELVDDPIEHARHLALAADGPDPVVAESLDRAAAAARAGGALLAAADLGELAVQATPDDDTDQNHGRVLQAARDLLAAGAADRARSIGHELLTHATAGPVRAETLLLLSELEGDEGLVTSEVELLRAALGEALGSPELELVIRLRLGNAVRFQEGPDAGLLHARAALELAEALGDDVLLSRALATVAELMLYAGEAGSIIHAERSLAIASRLRNRDAVDNALWALGCCFTWMGRVEEARDALSEAYESLAGRDDVRSKLVLWLLAVAELRAGRWELARQYAEQRVELAEMLGEEDPNASIPLALIAAYQGEEREARALAERGIALADAADNAFVAGWHRGVLGLLESWSGNRARAVELFSTAMAVRRSAGFREPGSPLYLVDYIETLIELGRIDDALALLEPWEAHAIQLERDWVLAQTTRCRGQIAAARGTLDEAERLLTEAVAKHQAAGALFGRGRALLALGITRRRARQKQAAQEAIEAALEAFSSLGARRWIEKARGELGRIGGRTREQGLTSAERRVAALVVAGQTNREVAAALFLSERTVESHLTHVYAKLGVRSRTELARVLP
jgi:DNA-binding CsgD family transcriptional regulator